jgi:hypothetical protein
MLRHLRNGDVLLLYTDLALRDRQGWLRAGAWNAPLRSDPEDDGVAGVLPPPWSELLPAGILTGLIALSYAHGSGRTQSLVRAPERLDGGSGDAWSMRVACACAAMPRLAPLGWSRNRTTMRGVGHAPRPVVSVAVAWQSCHDT